ncbi:hypothetical protein ACGRHY_19275 [Streptomyces sp. HK10]
MEPAGRCGHRFAYGSQESVSTFFLLLHGRDRPGGSDPDAA